MFSDKIYRNAQNKFGEYQLQLFGEFLNQQSTLFERLSVWGIDDDTSSSSSSSTATSVIQIISSSLNQINDFNEFYYNPDLSLYHLTKRHIRPIEIKNSLQNYENISKFQLIKTDNILNKIILTFYQLCDECEIIIKLCKKYAIKFLYINEDLCLTENSNNNNNNNNNNCNINNNNNNNNNNQTINGAIFNNHNDRCYFKISKSLKFLCNTQYLIQYCVIISTTMLHQLAALYTNDADICLNNIQMEQIFTILGRLSKELIIFDEIFANSSFLKYWSSYKKTINSINGNTNNRKTSLNDFNDSEINSLINLLNELESKLFTGNLFQNFLDNTYQVKQQLNAKAIGLLSNHFQEHIRNVLDIISKYPTDLSEFHETDLLVEINALCVIFHNVFGQIDQKHIKNLIKYNSKYIGTALIGNVIWCPEHFLSKNAETLIKPYDKYFTDATKLRQIYIQKKVQNLPSDVKMYCSQISLWSLHMKSLLKMTICDLKSENFKQSCSLFLKGLQFAGQISYIIKSVTNLHHQLRLEMPSTCITSICKLIECLKIIREIFITNIEHILRINQCVIQYLQYKGLILITTAKKRLETESYSDRNVDALSALQIAEKCLCGTSSKSRIMLANLAVSVSNPNYLLSSDYTKFQKIMYRLELISQLQNHLFELCDPLFMYWNQSNLLINIKNNVDQTNPYTFIHLLKYADDCCKLLKYLNVDCLELSEEMKKNNYEKYKTEILDKLCVQTEIFLRIEVHLESLLQAEQHNQNKLLNPYMETIYDYRDLIKKFKIQLNGNHVTLKNSIEDYFTNTFYNLTTIALHDWKIYCEMRHLAQTKFDLYSIEDYLPNQTLEQGIDILEIMRNIHVFVSKYRYNMNNQIFVEQSSKNKYLNTIGIQHIANSLKTHGMGILNTSVNFTYQFLRKKFYTFSQFLYDEQIRSRLMKDLKYFRDNSEKLNQMYSYDRADHFNKSIRKLGLMSDGQSYLDLFRQLITHIGNAMGYIRLIRSGGIHANYNASMYLPNMNEDDYKFGKYSKESNLTDTTINAGENLEENIENLCNNASKKTEYFNLLLEAFSGFFRDPKNIHLKTFYLIIPPLTINFVEHMLMAKDKIYKNDSKLYYHRLYSNSGDNIGDNSSYSSNSNNTTVGSGGGSSNSSSSNSTNYCEALFFDDGFAIGLMYILKLLNQIIEFNSLHWFESIKNKFDLERSKIITQQQNMSRSPSDNVHDEKLQQTLSLTEKRIKAYETEFKLLYYNLNSAKIFFQ